MAILSPKPPSAANGCTQRAGLMSRDRDAQRRPSRLVAQPLAEATEWLERYREFGDSFGALEWTYWTN